jgi:hypothetical protein
MGVLWPNGCKGEVILYCFWVLESLQKRFQMVKNVASVLKRGTADK